MHRALLMDADAVVELTRAAPPHEDKNASRQQVNRIRYYGTAVKLAEIPPDQAKDPGTIAE
ncbi:MAG: hypothetical protein NTV99_04045 [Deltaproteobacteria bacterium]|nr:hypothetical protein [Deltaproteobacteria bacterium]